MEKFVDSKITYGIIFLLIFSTGAVFAQESLVSVKTDDNNYDEGDTIVISGQVTTMIGETPVTLQLFSNGNLIDIAQIKVAQDGSYSHTVIAEGPLWQNQGNYLVRSSYGEGNVAETEFSYTSKQDVVETTTNFEVDAGSHGTFDVEYTINGAIVEDMLIDSKNISLIVKIEAIDEGRITLDLPREFIGAEKQDGKDEIFIILIDGIEVAYEESVVHNNSRVITINFEEGDSEIHIIGTYAIPEFGAIIMIVMATSMIFVILLSKKQISSKILRIKKNTCFCTEKRILVL